jgi:hypothetical protein
MRESGYAEGDRIPLFVFLRVLLSMSYFSDTCLVGFVSEAVLDLQYSVHILHFFLQFMLLAYFTKLLTYSAVYQFENRQII